MGTDSEMTASETGGRLGGGIEQKGKGLMDMDDRVVIDGGRGCKRPKWQWKKYNKD